MRTRSPAWVVVTVCIGVPKSVTSSDRAKQVGGICELHVYPKLGHILSRNLDPHAQEEGPFDPDPAAVQDAHAKEDAFLRRIGYVR